METHLRVRLTRILCQSDQKQVLDSSDHFLWTHSDPRDGWVNVSPTHSVLDTSLICTQNTFYLIIYIVLSLLLPCSFINAQDSSDNLIGQNVNTWVVLMLSEDRLSVHFRRYYTNQSASIMSMCQVCSYATCGNEPIRVYKVLIRWICQILSGSEMMKMKSRWRFMNGNKSLTLGLYCRIKTLGSLPWAIPAKTVRQTFIPH